MSTDWQTDVLPELAQRIMARLHQAYATISDPWRLPVLATIGPEGPDARVVVLRDVLNEGRELVAFSDRRAPKIAQIHQHPRIALVFYDAEGPIQLRILGEANVQEGSDRERWAGLSDAQRQNYRSLATPGTPVDSPSDGWTTTDRSGLEEFAVIRITVETLDWLWLARAGHRRAKFTWKAGSWSGRWVVP
jgi:pyridoxamine 5'-phosphate oxidase